MADYFRAGIVPSVSGAEPTMEEVLTQLAEDVKTLTVREEKGEDVKDELANVQKALDDALVEVKANGTKNEDPTDGLSDEDRDSFERWKADKAAAETQKNLTTVAEAVSKQIAEGGSIEDAIKSVLAEHPGTSRYVGQNASEELVKHIAAGGSYTSAPPRFSETLMGTKVGDVRGAKEIMERKSIAEFMGIISRWRQGPWAVGDHEKAFLIESQGGAKALAEGTGSAGGFLVPTEWMPDILGLLRARAVVRAAGPRIVPINKLMNQTSVSTGATAYYTAENAAIPTSEPSFAEAALLSPKNLTGLVPVSNYLLNDAPGAEELVRQDLSEVIALREDLAFLRGTGGGGEPTGLRNIGSITLNPIAVTGTPNGFQITLPQLRRVKAAFRTMNAGAIRPVMFFHPSVLTYLETLTDTTGRFLADRNILTIDEANGPPRGTLDGIPYFTTTQLPANITMGTANNTTEIYLVNMAETIVGINQELELSVSSEAMYTPDGGTTFISAFQNNQTLFRAVVRHDITHRRPAQIVVQTGVLI
jgi:HK97 family phage major capsid protein